MATHSTLHQPIDLHNIFIRFLAGLLFTAILLLEDSLLAAENDEPKLIQLSVDDVAQILDKDDWIVVDARNSNAYNGWALDEVQRGGHLPGAVDFPADWLEVRHKTREEILATALRAKGITQNKHIVIYGTRASQCQRLASYLRAAGCQKLYSFDFSLWTKDKTKPLIRYKNFHLIVPPSIVKSLLDGRSPETFEDAQIKFVEASWGDENASYLSGHVPRSFHVNTDHFEPPPKWKLGNPETLTRFAAQYGFHQDDTAIISGKDPTASYRLAIVLRYMGLKDVRVLNGGFDAWKAAGYPTETERTAPPQSASFGGKIPRRTHLVDQTDVVKSRLEAKADRFALVDTRTWDEFTGQTSGYKYHPHKGRIPGSLYGQATFTGKNSLTPYRNIDKTMRNADEILAVWQESGIRTDEHLSFMCGGGWRAAEVLTYAQVIGLDKTSLYSDGWIGWSNVRTNPVETGVPKKE